jgi:four helix bundle protein
MIKSYKDLLVWKEAIALVEQVYAITKKFPKEEIYGLVNQMRRSAVSIPSNIAEGRSRQYGNEFKQFLYISIGSCSELETQLIIAEKLGYIEKSEQDLLLEKLDYIGRMIRNLIKNLREPRTESREPNNEE